MFFSSLVILMDGWNRNVTGVFHFLNLNKLWAATHEENIAPIKVLNVTGFTRVENKPYYVEGVGNTRVRAHFELLNRP